MSAETTFEGAVDTGIKVLTFITWTKLVQLVLLLILAAVGLYAWENRPSIYHTVNVRLGHIGNDHIPEISKKSKVNIKFMVDKEPTIVAAQLVNIDFRKNEKHPIYFYSDVSVLTTDMEVYEDTKVSSSPLFISGDEVNNSRFVSILNGDFVCVPTPARLVKVVPLAGKVAAAICSISVPPYYGELVGYASLWLDHLAAPEEIPNYRAIARTLAIDIYERDVKAGEGQ